MRGGGGGGVGRGQAGLPPFRVPSEHLDVLNEEIKEVRRAGRALERGFLRISTEFLRNFYTFLCISPIRRYRISDTEIRPLGVRNEEAKEVRRPAGRPDAAQC